MQGLELRNDQVSFRVLRDARLCFESAVAGGASADWGLEEGSAKVDGAEPVAGLFYYGVPCVFESLVVRVEGRAGPLIQRSVGEWPATVDDEQLELYPHLHLLEERKTGKPWRLERWYTLAGTHLVFETEQYFERSCPRRRGKDWERLIAQLRQVIDLLVWPGGMEKATDNLLSAS